MKVLVAGATGAIGKPLLGCLRAAGHELFALVRSPDRTGALAAAGADEIVADALDHDSVLEAVRHVRPDAIINELTSLPKHYTPEDMKAAAPRDKEVRVNGNANLLAAARAANCPRYLLQSTGFWYAPGEGLADEAAPFAFDASPGIAAGCRTYADLESAAQQSGVQVVLLRYGFFYGPGTWFTKEGDVGEQVRRGEFPVIGKGQGFWNWVHINDAAAATCAALTADPGVYNVVGDQPVAQSVWLPAFAEFVGAPPPPTVSEEQALRSAGPDSVFYATKLRGASNDKAKRQLAFRPRSLEWLRSASAIH
ncbi:MAG: NAD(P)-dependent oxidoreductase [Acidobacteriaceae bacterium]|nr:NAD(P)-dependent oxidoreductase [Acidobacteriaceae bacterium]MBV8569515.1 NAD(P)-dependent oxidoreductase [Acidobacteriaceae bacterium]